MGLVAVSLQIKRQLDVNMFLNPSKKLKLDLPNNHNANFENDDEWGADDITAEEFDFLETQATQKLAGNPSKTILQSPPATNGINQSTSVKEDQKQLQYELEGKVKILSDSKAKLLKELNEEKINRNKIIAEKVKEFSHKENTFRKEIQRLESVLQFKSQEMKNVYDKVFLLEMQLKEKKKHLEQEKKDNAVKEDTVKEKKTDPQSSKFQDNFLNKFQFETESTIHSTSVQNKNKERFRRNKLQIDAPEGKTKGSGIVSSVLCNRLSIPPGQSSFMSPIITSLSPNALKRNCAQISPVSVARLNSDNQTEELLDYFDSVLKNYVIHLNGISNKYAVAGPSTTSPLSLRRKESIQDRCFAISVLKDLTLFLSCHQFLSLVQKWDSANMDSDESKKVTKQIESNQVSSAKLTIRERTASKFLEVMHSLLQSLLCLSNPNSYPIGYTNIEGIEWSVSALISWSSAAPQSLIQFASEIPIASLVNSYHSKESLLLVLNFLSNVCMCKEIIPVITHKDDNCVLCSLGSLLLHKISASPVKFINVMLLVEDFFSGIFTLYSFSELKLESSSCSSLILQGIVTSLWKFYEICKDYTKEIILIFRKGFTLLHFLSRCFPNFKERRAGFGNDYISLVSGMLMISKENSLFRDFYDLIHELWDFQDDASELDLDEPTEDSVPNMDLLSETSS